MIVFLCACNVELSEAVHKAKEEEIQIPFGVGVAGTVAETKQVVNIRNAYQVSISSNSLAGQDGWVNRNCLYENEEEKKKVKICIHFQIFIRSKNKKKASVIVLCNSNILCTQFYFGF